MADPKSSFRCANTEGEVATHCAGVHSALAHPVRVAGFVDGNGEVSTFAGRRATADGEVPRPGGRGGDHGRPRAMKRWYVVHTHPRGERLAAVNLRRQGLGPYLPQYLKRRCHARRTEWIPAPLFPGYLFVAMDVETVRWRAIHSTVGVRYLVCHGDWPAPVPAGIVEEVQAREDEQGLVAMDTPPPFEKGEQVRITAGAFCDQVGLFDCATDNERIIVLLELLGRHVKVRLPPDAVAVYA